LRRVASGLMIEKVRSAMGGRLLVWEFEGRGLIDAALPRSKPPTFSCP
jgi:hypothetical protein